MRRILTRCCLFLMILAWSGTAGASMITILRGESPAVKDLKSMEAKGIIVLTFGGENVVIHDGSLKLAGAAPIHQDVSRDKLFLIRDHRAMADRKGYEVLYSHSGFQLAKVENPHELAVAGRLSLKPVTGSRVVVEKADLPKAAPDPAVEKILNRMNEAHYENFLSTLSEDFPTRYLCSREIVDARDLIRDHFKKLGLKTYVQEFTASCWPKRCEAPQGYNVIGIKKGTSRPDEFCLVGAHYDSVNQKAPCQKAPGANDNGSGAAGVMELARVFSKVKSKISLVFVAFGGEEQGMLGSKALARSMLSAKPFANLKARNLKSFVMLDMIAYYKKNYGVLVEGSSGNARQKAAAAKLVTLGRTYTDLEMEKTFDYGESDHEPFLDRNMAGALLIETDWDSYSYYHTGWDLMKYQKIPFAMDVLRLTGAMLATEAAASLPAD